MLDQAQELDVNYPVNFPIDVRISKISIEERKNFSGGGCDAARISWSQASFHVTTGIYFKRRKPPAKDLSGEQAIPGHVVV